MHAQRYDLAGGLRFGKGIGGTVAYRFAKKMTAEAVAFSSLGSSRDLILLGRYHGRIAFQKRLNYFLGAGAHIGGRKEVSTVGGAAFVLGLEFTISRYNISFDYLVLNNIQEKASTFERQAGISLRYVFMRKKGKRYLPKWKLKI